MGSSSQRSSGASKSLQQRWDFCSVSFSIVGFVFGKCTTELYFCNSYWVKLRIVYVMQRTLAYVNPLLHSVIHRLVTRPLCRQKDVFTPIFIAGWRAQGFWDFLSFCRGPQFYFLENWLEVLTFLFTIEIPGTFIVKLCSAVSASSFNGIIWFFSSFSVHVFHRSTHFLRVSWPL